MERIQRYPQTSPAAKLITRHPSSAIVEKQHTINRETGAEDVISIPVIFHIVLPNPYIIPDEAVQSQLNELNLAFSGLNADSTNAPGFYPVRGHSVKIKFVAARQTPSGGLSNGIERIKSATASNANMVADPIKRSSLGGVNAWGPAAYLNCWIGDDVSGKRILGYAQFPGAGLAEDDGIFCNYQSFGLSSCNKIAYNKGRTIVHEAGHYFGLFHIWGDDDGCGGDDFRQLSDAGSSVVLPAGLFNAPGKGNTSADIGDTPNQGTSTTSCLSGMVTDACAVAAPGKMYQNYMDYTADNCYSLFTNKQVERMEWILDNVRNGFKTSQGGMLPANTISLDAAVSGPVNPGGAEAIGCSSFIYPSVLSCPGNFTPKVRISNNGTQTISALTAGLKINGLAQIPVAINLGNDGLVSGESIVAEFPPVTAISGTYNLQFYLLDVNGGGKDFIPANDTLATTLSIAGANILPAFEGFESPAFPSLKWFLYNPDGGATWAKFKGGSNSSNSMFIDNFSKNNIGLTDELRTPKLLIPATDSLIISFDLAHKNYPGLNDRLSVLVSGDCEATWTTVYTKAGDSLATAGSTTLQYTSPDADDWKNQQITIGGSLVSTGEVIIAIRNTGDYGNNIFIDNINVYKQNKRDITAAAITSPAAFECTQNIIVPQIEISNRGVQPVTSFKAGYTINNKNTVYKKFVQTIMPGTKVMVALDTLVALKDTNQLVVFTAEPAAISGTGDENMINDTISKIFIFNKTIAGPLTEGFEDTNFLPSNWVLISADSANTWIKKLPGSNSSAAAFINNFSGGFSGQPDALKTPAVNISGGDGAVISFDIAHKNYPGADDQLNVKISADCGNTFSIVYSKSGASLATAGSSAIAYTTPLPQDWETRTIILDSAFTAGGTIIAEFENKSGHGNNIFLDNIRIAKIFKTDLKLIAVKQPAATNCTNASIEPVVSVANAGIDTITAFKVCYIIDSNTTVTKNITGIVLPPNQQIDVNLNGFSSTPGTHFFTVFSMEPVTVKGIGDLNTANDTIRSVFLISGTQPALPLTQDFEGSSFPSSGWGIINPDGKATWIKSAAAAKQGTASMEINNFDYGTANAADKFISPVIISNNKNDSVFLSFDLAYNKGAADTGSAGFAPDTLEIQVTKDCGNTYQTVWKRWGENLQTVNGSNSPVSTSFIPGKNEWKNIRCYLTPFVGKENFQVYFVSKSNKQNNIWIDNINIYAKVLPQKLKDQGYLVYPNPFRNNFLIHHYAVPADLNTVKVYNAAGQLVWDKRYNGNAPTEITVDLSENTAGVYMLKLFYSNRTIEEKIIKQ
jgi:hypothetical protein